MPELLALAEYEKIANHIIRKFISRRGRPSYFDQDFLTGEVINVLVRSDLSYKEDNKTGRTLLQYRRYNVWRAIKKILNKNHLYQKKKEQLLKKLPAKQWSTVEYEVNKNDDVGLQLNYLINNSGLTPLQHQYINYMREGMSQIDIARQDNKSKQDVSQIVNRAFDNMRKIIKDD